MRFLLGVFEISLFGSPLGDNNGIIFADSAVKVLASYSQEFAAGNEDMELQYSTRL